MPSALPRANKRGFGTEVLNMKNSNVKFFIGKMPSTLPRAIKMVFIELGNINNDYGVFSIPRLRLGH